MPARRSRCLRGEGRTPCRPDRHRAAPGSLRAWTGSGGPASARAGMAHRYGGYSPAARRRGRAPLPPSPTLRPRPEAREHRDADLVDEDEAPGGRPDLDRGEGLLQPERTGTGRDCERGLRVESRAVADPGEPVHEGLVEARDVLDVVRRGEDGAVAGVEPVEEIVTPVVNGAECLALGDTAEAAPGSPRARRLGGRGSRPRCRRPL